jgi:protein phosphatase PTC2/3
MVAEAEVMHQAAVPVLEVQYHRCVAKGVEEVVGMSAAAAAPAEVGVEVEVAVEVPQMVSG